MIMKRHWRNNIPERRNEYTDGIENQLSTFLSGQISIPYVRS
jgi:hypothetical protein